MSRFDQPWLPREIKILSDRWKLGFSASLIKEELPRRSRNAIIGKARRLGLKRRPSPIIRKAS